MSKSEKFYRQCYQRTNGWIPMMPLGGTVKLGDFGQIADSKFLPLGNIAELKSLPNDIPEEPAIKVCTGIELNSDDWQMSDGIEIENTSRQSTRSEYGGEDNSLELLRERSIWFASKGSFSFNCSAPRAEFILNWNQINQIIMLGLTLLDHSYREVYVVTRVASVDRWELAIAKAKNAELKVTSRVRDADLGNFTNDASAEIQQSRGLDIYDKGIDRPAHFFQAKKLIMSDVKRDHYVEKILNQRDTLPSHIIANLLKTDLLNMVEKNELNQPYFSECDDSGYDNKEDKIEPCCKINLAPYFEFFDWADISLDDVAKLC